jgi:hypothetical protein
MQIAFRLRGEVEGVYDGGILAGIVGKESRLRLGNGNNLKV